MDSRPLAGIRILEVGAYISAPYAGALLCALGADVVKVEPPGAGDAFRRGVGESSPYFVQYNTGKKSLAVNLKDPAGVELIKALLPNFDVMLENYRPGKMAALGLGPDACHAINPQLIYASVSGFGNGGPLRDRPAYDTIGQSMGGLYSVLNDAGEPRLTGTCLADMVTAVATAMGILAALVGRERDPARAGTLMETSLLEAVSMVTIDAVTQMHEMGETPTRESRHPQAQNFCLKTKTGEAISIHLSSSQKFWQSLVSALGRDDLTADPRFSKYFSRMENFQALKAILEQEFAKRSLDEASALLENADVPFAPVMPLSDLLRHPQVEWLELVEKESDHEGIVRPPWRFSGKRPSRRQPPPRVGEHTGEIAAEAYDQATIDTLRSRGTIA